MRKKFDKTKEIHAIKQMQTVEETRMLRAVGSEAFKGRFKEHEKAEIVSGEISAAKVIVKVEEGGKGWGKAVVNVRTGFEEAAAFFWDVERLGEVSLSRGGALRGLLRRM